VLAPDIASPTRCPSDHFQGGSHYRNVGSSYYYNARGQKVGANNGLDGATCTLTAVTEPAKVVLACEYAVNYAFAISDGYGTHPEYLGPHQPGTAWGNAAFVDGPVAWVHFNGSGANWYFGPDWTFKAQ